MILLLCGHFVICTYETFISVSPEQCQWAKVQLLEEDQAGEEWTQRRSRVQQSDVWPYGSREAICNKITFFTHCVRVGGLKPMCKQLCSQYSYMLRVYLTIKNTKKYQNFPISTP